MRENVTGDLSLQKLQVRKDAAALVTKEDWEGFCRHTETVESQYSERDGILPDALSLASILPVIVTARTVILTVTTVKLPMSTILLLLIKTLTWSLQSHYRVSSHCFCLGSGR
jgi:hypothetical protein